MLSGRAAQDLRELRARPVRALRRGPDRQAVPVRRGERAARLHRHGGQAGNHALGPHDVRRAGERARHVARALLPAHERLARPRVNDHGKRLVVDLDALGEVLGLRARGGDDRRDGLADVAHLAVGEQRVRDGRDVEPGRRHDLRAAPHGRRSWRRSSGRHAPRARGRGRAASARTPCAARLASRTSSRNTPRPLSSRASSRRRTGWPRLLATPTAGEITTLALLWRGPARAHLVWESAYVGSCRAR